MMLRSTITFAALLCAVSLVAQNAPLPSIECDKAHAKDCTSAPPPGKNPAAPSTAEKFPFPDEAPATPSTPTSPKTGGSTADRFPFPGSDLDKVPVAEDPSAESPAPSSSSTRPPSAPSADDGMSSSSSSQDAEPAPTTQSDDAPVTASPLPNYGTKRNKVDEETRRRNEENRVPDDLKVGKFYANDGNWNGAYLRYKDAAEHDPDEPEAQYGWAAAAEKLGKPEEAREHYAAYLKLDPSAEHAKDARVSLDRLSGKGSSAKAGKK